MRLFHVSEESGIRVFEPRIPLRKDLDQTVGLVWAAQFSDAPGLSESYLSCRGEYDGGGQEEIFFLPGGFSCGNTGAQVVSCHAGYGSASV